MPAFFVHGVPETHHLWDDVRSHLSRKDIIAPDMPGFGCDTPARLRLHRRRLPRLADRRSREVGEPVDIVGHDWGALLSERLVMLRPDLVRTWAAAQPSMRTTSGTTSRRCGKRLALASK